MTDCYILFFLVLLINSHIGVNLVRKMFKVSHEKSPKKTFGESCLPQTLMSSTVHYE